MFDAKTKILVIDDMSTMRKIVIRCLKECGFSDISEAPDGQAAWALIESANPNFQLVISDWNMPNLTGLELLKKVRADNRFATLPFVLVTAESEASQVSDALKAKVDGYVVKPFSSDNLKVKLQDTYAKIFKKTA